jgi:hypothetical protein
VGGGAWPFLVGGAICLVNSEKKKKKKKKVPGGTYIDKLAPNWALEILQKFCSF